MNVFTLAGVKAAVLLAMVPAMTIVCTPRAEAINLIGVHIGGGRPIVRRPVAVAVGRPIVRRALRPVVVRRPRIVL